MWWREASHLADLRMILLRILLHSDGQVFADQTSCHTSSLYLRTSDYIISSLAVHVWSAYHLATYSKCDFQNICSKFNSKFICASSSQLCLNRHRTGTKLLFFLPFSSSYPFLCYIMCGFSYQDWHPFVRGCTPQ